MIITLGEYTQDPVAKNLQRAPVFACQTIGHVVRKTGKLVGLLTRQQYACKGGIGVTFKLYAYLKNGTDTTYIWQTSLNGGSLTEEQELRSLLVGKEILQQYVEKHGLPDSEPQLMTARGNYGAADY